MKNFLLLAAFCGLTVLGYAQSQVAFDEELQISNFAPQEFVLPPSPLTTQVIFVGGYDIVQTTPTYGNPAGRAIAKEWHDFIGFTPDSSGSSLGWVTVNHEMIYQDDRIGDGGGMTAFRIEKDANGEIVVMDQTLEDGRQGQFFNIDFVNTVGETGMNCAGISAPNGRIWTAEEWFRSSTGSINNGSFSGVGGGNLPSNPSPERAFQGVRDTSMFTINAPEFPLVDGKTIPKYQNFNYMVEVDPKQAVAIRKQYNWGRAGWEGGAITPDGKYAYLGIDGVPAPWVRVTATTPWDFTDVTVEVYKHDNPQGQRWIAIDMNEDNMLGGLTNAAWAAGATMYMRNEWVAIDPATGIVYWTETGRDSGSSGPGIVFPAVAAASNAVIAPHHTALAQERGFADATDPNYQDYYGRVLYYDPATEEVGVAIDGGPYFENGSSEIDEANYPDKHLSNPDGLNILTIGGKSFLMIQEDLNGSSFGRMPNGISNRLCELYLLAADNAKDASVDDLVRITAIPAGAEITGAIQIDDNTILVNSQHPNANNPFPYNHSVTMAIHGFASANVTTDLIEAPEAAKSLTVYPNPTTREVFLSETTDFALYNVNGQRLKVYRNANHADLGNFAAGTYYIITAKKESYKIIVQ